MMTSAQFVVPSSEAKKNPDKLNTCRGSHSMHCGWRRNTHTVPEMYRESLRSRTPFGVYSALDFASDTQAATRLRSRSSAFASSQAAM